jgi:hypothetical protein|uniref:Uncharacterized protein n=2 Tax=Picea TaxID=3328 RepID=A0A101LW10_PICGL|nr:hypothetical protein ABT39_MTgene1491 [Picea glauca]QHR92660.1 hypothetical protein Q903MT_gene6708 [Picea sitchensis]
MICKQQHARVYPIRINERLNDVVDDTSQSVTGGEAQSISSKTLRLPPMFLE